MIIKAIDPGVHKCAVAYGWVGGGHLTSVAFESEADPGRRADAVVVERPQVDGRNINPQTYIDLTASAYLLAGRSAMSNAPVVSYTPRQWKGSLAKPVHHAHVIKALNGPEFAVLADFYPSIKAPRGDADFRATINAACKKGAADRWRKAGHLYYPRSFVMHNILDAVGLLLHYTGRLVVVKRGKK